jgi:hypothetical protein
MRKAAVLGVALSAAVVIAATMVGANADGSTTIQWQGQGSDNLPCSSGGHWILADSHGQGWAVTSATLTVNGQSYTMTQNGGGSWSADSNGALDSNSSASATITHSGTLPSSGGPQLVLSSCAAGTGSGGGGGGGGSGGGGTGGGGGTSGGGGTMTSGQGAASAGASGVAANAGTAQAATAVNASPGFTG